MTTRLIVFNCPHNSDRPPLGRKEGYREQILAKIEEVGRICRSPVKDPETKTIAICTGDLFHSKRPSFTSHYLVGQLQQIFWQYGVDTYILPGNHDTGPAGVEGLRKQPLSVLDGGPVHVMAPGVTDAPQVLALQDCAVFWRPYSYERDADPTYYQLDEKERIIAEGSPHGVMVTHGSILPPDSIRPYPHVLIDQIDTTGIDIFLAGHIHEDLGVKLVNNTWFCNIGALSRPSRTDESYERHVSALELTITEGLPPAIERHPLVSMLPAEEVFHDKLEVVDEVSDEIVDFASALATGLQDDTVPIQELLEGLKLDPDVQALVIKFLEEAGL